MKDYRLCILFPSGSELVVSCSFPEVQEWVEKEKFGYKIISCNGYTWMN
jgi:hypothetical protein